MLKYKNFKIFLLIFNILLLGCHRETYLYLGQNLPKSKPKIFAFGIISLPNRNEEVITFSPNGKEIYYSIEYYPNPKPSFTMFIKFENNKWSEPDTANFSINRRTSEPHIALNGTRIYYFANKVKNQKGNLDICYSEKIADKWSEPISLTAPPNFLAPNYSLHPCIVADTSIYFCSNLGEICRSQYLNGKYQAVKKLPSPINYENLKDAECWGDAYVSPKEDYMIFRSNRTGGFGGSDLYITFKKKNGDWANPINLGNKINSQFDELGGDITPDGKYMTFGRNGDIYWVSADFIKQLKKKITN